MGNAKVQKMIFLRNVRTVTVVRSVGILLSFVIALGAWAYASPIGADPDGNFHLASIWCGQGYETGKCEPPSEASKNVVPKIVKVPQVIAVANGCRPGAAAYAASCTAELVLQNDMTETGYNNAGRLYPNGYYWVASHLVTDDAVQSIIRIRFMNILLFMILITAVNIVLPSQIKRSVNLTHLVLLLPLGLFLIASNNPSSWAISGLGTFWAFLYGYLTIDNRNKIIAAGLFTFLSALMAMQARADSAAFVIVVSVFVCCVAFIRNKPIRNTMYKRLALPFLILIPAYLTYASSSQSSAISKGLLAGEKYGRDPLVTILWNITRLPGMFAGIFGYNGAGGGLGWLDVVMPEIVTLMLVFVFAYLVSQSSVKRPSPEVLTLVGFLGLICAMPLVILQKDQAFVGENFQSRYLLPSVLALAGLYFSRSTILDGDAKYKSQRIITAVILVSAYLVALHTTIRRYVTGNDVLDWNLNRAREWWWYGVPAPLTIWIIGSVAFATLVTLVLFFNDRQEIADNN